MGKVELIRLPVSKSQAKMMTIGVDNRKFIDTDHELHFIRIFTNIKKEMNKLDDGTINVLQIPRLANRYVTLFRNDNENMTLNSLHEILMWCQENEVLDVVFSEHELNKITINQVQDLVNNYDVNVYISVNK